MSDDMTGAMAPSAVETAQDDTASAPMNSAAPLLNGASAAPATAPPAVDTATASAVEPPAAATAAATADSDASQMEAAMQQMPPLDEIDVPGGDEGGSGGGQNGEGRNDRGGRGGGNRGGDRRGGGNRGGDRGGSSNSGDPRIGHVVTGEVVKIDNDGVLVDVGMKSEGLIRPNELTREPVANINDIVKVGDKIDVFVMESERGGDLLLSKKRADFEKAWDTVQDALGDGRTLQAVVSDRVRGGLVVDLGIRGFVPASHVGSGKLKNLEKYVGTTVPLKVLEVDRNARKVVLSHRLATEEERQKEKEETINALAEGQVKTGTVRRVTDYGAFVDLGGIDGLLHVSEMSWTRVKHPSDVVKVGDQVQVVILKMSLDQGRVSLGMRQILPDPWEAVAEKYHVGDTVEGEVTRLVPFGAFVLLEGGIEGIVPNGELSHRRIVKPSDVVEQGQMVQVKVVDVRPDERRLTLSLRALQPREAAEEYRPRPAAAPGAAPAPDEAGGTARREKRERRGGRGGRDEEGEGDFRQYMASSGSTGGGFGGGSGVTLGDIFGDMLAGAGSGKAGKTGGKRGGRRRNEEEEDDLSDLDNMDDLDVMADEPTEVDAEADETK